MNVMRTVLRVLIPFLLIGGAFWSAYLAVFCGWAVTAAPHENNDSYRLWGNIYSALCLLAILSAAVVCHVLRPGKPNRGNPSQQD